jgi:Tfp pilus assembly protein PilF
MRAAALLALALSACKTAAPIHPLAIEHNTYGTRYLEEGNLDKAQHRFELALEYNPDYPEPFNNLCLIDIRRGKLDRAKERCIKALRLNNDFAEAHNNLGYIYLQQSSNGKAHDAFKSALRVNPGYIEARYNLALTLLKLKRFADARVEYDKIIEVNPNIADPHHDLCVMDLEEGNSNEAIQECLKAVELDPKFANAFFHLGKAYMVAGKQCDAQEAYKQCIAADTGHAECLNNVDIAARKCALQSPQLKELKDQAADENNPAALYKLAVAEKEKGLLNEAERHLKKCTRADGRFGLCYCLLAELSRQVSKNDDARAFCKKCVNYTSSEQTVPEREICERMQMPEE